MYLNINKKRILRRNRLLKKLFYKVAKNVLNKKIYKFITFKISDKNYSLCSTSYTDSARSIIKNIVITLGIYGIKSDSRRGYSDHYYNNRGLFINKHIRHNRRKAILFIFYHELYHVKARLYTKHFHNDNEELFADRFAIDNLKKLK